MRAVQWLSLAGLTACTAAATAWLRAAIAARPDYRDVAAPAAHFPAAARDEQRLADTPLWRLGERAVAQRALLGVDDARSLRLALNLDHGPGGIACALAVRLPAPARVVAVDPTDGMADLARHRARRRGQADRLTFVRARPHALPFRDGAFDLVVGVAGLHQWANPQAAFPEARRILAAHGRYFLADFRRNLSLAAWLVVRFVQTALTPRDLQEIDEPSASVAAAFAPHEAEWLAARAQLPDVRVRTGWFWLAIERGGPSERAARTLYSLR